VTRGERVPFNSPDEWYPADLQLQQALPPVGLKSGIIFPLRENHEVLGMIIFGIAGPTVSWSGRLLDRLGMFSDVISQFIARSNALLAIATSRSEARRLAGNLLTAQEDERRRISREIHDDVCQRLVAAVMQIRLIEQQMDQPATAVSSLASLRETVVNLSRDVQHLSRKLHPAILDELGLADAIRSECNRLTEAGYLQVDFRCLPLPATIDKRAALCLYRILQEALWNVVKHAETKQARVRLSSDVEALYLEVSDHGRGFNSKTSNSHTGLGIVSFKERVRLLGGTIEISSAPNQGTRLWIMLPISAEES
jgi:signal transduction histidine kinase